MDIAILGAGNIGRTLGGQWAVAGHRITYGVRDAKSPKTLTCLDAVQGATAKSFARAIDFGKVVVFAVSSSAVDGVLKDHGAALNGKLVVDATNRFGQPEVSHVNEIVDKAPQAQVFRAFNTLGWEVFARPRFGDVTADLLFCGPDGEARETMEALIGDVGLRPVRVGDLDQLRVVDALGELWITLAVKAGLGRHTAFKVLSEI